MAAKAKTFAEVIDVVQQAQEDLYGAKAAFVRLSVPFAEMKDARAAAADWVDDVVGEMEGMITRLRESQAAMSKAGIDVDGSAPAAKRTAAPRRTNGTAAKAATARVKAAETKTATPKTRGTGGRSASKTKGGAGKVVAEPAPAASKHKVEVPAA